jgi:N-acetylglucosamine kinase-like BadF-type ATPase
MILIADSGSTKCDWILTNPQGEKLNSFSTMGFNPMFHSSEVIASEINKSKGLVPAANQIEAIYYYGSGNSSEHYNSIVKEGLKTVFTKAKLHIHHDVLASAYATYTGEPCISCILGTGSNSFYFDGENLSQVKPALGYILGDEGSGTYFGKQLLQDYLYKKLPTELSQDLEQGYTISKAIIFDKLYSLQHGNVYLASFGPFMAKHRSHPYFAELLQKGFTQFIKEHVLAYENAKQVPVHFVGSMAFYFQDELKQAAMEYGISIGNIIQKPIDSLLEYHKRYIFKK